jgi:hypothetical protein
MSKVVSLLAAVAVSAALAAPAGAYTVQSPDAADANQAAVQAQNVDLRSPDARDSGRVVVVPASLTAPVSSDDGGTDWGMIAIIGGGALLLGLACACTARFVVHHRRHTPVVS